jgi:molybdopterin-containing oxidoreductase family iron-sulfur binding subunit
MLKNGYSRREFLKVVGAGSGLAVTGCGTDLPEKLIPYVVQPDEIVPGVASWYSGSCNECQAGCGVIVRVRDGRATKSEGNPNHPVNRGALCALGQSSIQSHYDPDRVREPLMRELSGSFKTATWNDAVERVAGALKVQGKETVLITSPLSGSIKTLIPEFGKKLSNLTHIEYELLTKDVVDEGARKVFGDGVTTHFDFSKAEVILSVGADYLETWLSPVEFSRQWAEGRKPKDGGNAKAKISYTVHIEPRLSPTGGVQDKWVMNRPGSEAYLLAIILKLVLEKKSGQLPQTTAAKLKGELAAVSLEKVEEVTGVTALTVTSIVEKLLEAPSSLVVAGGASCSAPFPVECASLANLLNAALSNLGRSVILREAPRGKKPALEQLTELAQGILEGKRQVGAVIFSDTNPLYTLPPSHPLKRALGKVGLVAAVSAHLDETTNFAQVVLPLSSSFESWLDSEPAPGVYNLNQPAMAPLYQTQSLGDTILALGLKLDFEIEGVKNFEDYLKREWKKRLGEEDFQEKWDAVVERGGDFSKARLSESKSPSFVDVSLPVSEIAKGPGAGGKLLAFPTTLATDGRSANRAWMQEVPYPMTTSVWGSWIEIHPETAKRYGIGPKDVVKLHTPQGAIEAPAYHSKYIHPELVAMPLGYGHESYGRYATGVGASVIKVLTGAGAILPMLTSLSEEKTVEDPVTKAKSVFAPIAKSLAHEDLVIFSGNRDEPVNSQLGRGLIRSVPLAKLHPGKDGHHESHHDDGDDHGKGHHDPLAIGPQPPQVQMYEQMDHPLYKWGMTIDLNACTGCSACVVACYAENNIAVVGKQICNQGREMSWLRLERYFDGDEDQPLSGFLPMMCQHCNNAPCEPVCPVYATYHNEEGVNSMVYNRCVGTRYCLNNCSYKVRRFNWFKYDWPEPLTWQLNPDVTVRGVGVMEKCNFCTHRIIEAKNNAKNEGRTLRDGEVLTACQATCPTGAIRFGNLLDESSEVAKDTKNERSYKILDQYINTQPAVTYFAKIKHSGHTVEHAHASLGLRTDNSRGES